MKSFFKRALAHIEKAFDSGFFISDEFERALLLEQVARYEENATDDDQLDQPADKAA